MAPTKLLRLSAFLMAAATVSSTCAHAADLPARDADNGGLKLPPGFCALVAADNFGTARHIAVAPNGDLYVALQGMGGVAALHDSKGDGHFDIKEIIGDGSSTGVALQNGYLYIAKTSSVVRYKMAPGELKPAGEPEVVVSGLTAGRAHADKGIAFDGKGSLYVNVGAP